ncbi:hypothetical protein V6N11_000308 [Hibiscus sabdariffa]|uniref:RNase H type-1 domain-containing protein n=1 Tax=Hibiscus sabdariffa TaxID=183260 RepID=A0ABR1Z5L8_9ROSI
MDNQNATINWSFSHFIGNDGSWDVPLFSFIFPSWVVQHIRSNKCPDPSDRPDTCVWRWSPKHNFVTKLCYDRMIDNSHQPKLPIWKTIWNLQVPQRIQLFFWIAYKGRLLTNDERCHRGMTDSPTCPVCFHHTESIVHALWDCHNTCTLWKSIIPPSLNNNFFHINSNKWIESNIAYNVIHPKFGLPWKLLFAAIVWQIWKRRNEFIFNRILLPNEYVLRLSSNLAAFYAGNSQHTTPVTHRPIPAQWIAPHQGCLALKVDAAVSQSSGIAAVGGLIRDNYGSWKIGFQKALGITDVLQAELWAILLGLQLAWAQGHEIVEVQSDSQQAIALVSDNSAASSSLSLVRAIVKFRQRGWMLSFKWISREGNQPADALAKSANALLHSMVTLDSVPTTIQELINKDRLGPLYCESNIN